MLRGLLGVLVLSCLSGCAVKPYVAPTSGPQATLEVWGKSDDGTISFGVFTKPQCAGFRAVADGKSVLPTIPLPVASTKLVASQPATFLVASMGVYSYCPAIQSFTPVTDKEYIAFFETVGSGCRMSLFENVKDEAAFAILPSEQQVKLGKMMLTPVPGSKRLDYVKPWDLEDPMCPGQL